MKRFLATLLVIAMPLGILAGCNNETADQPNQQTESNTQTEGNETAPPSTSSGEKVISRFIGADPTTLDSATGGDSYGGYVVDATCEPLIRTSYIGNGQYEYIPAGAATWESNETGTVWTFHLNETYWEDGVQLTAHDYVYAIRRAVDPVNAAQLGYQLEFLKNFQACNTGDMPIESLGVVALDDMTLEIELEYFAPQFLELCSNRVTYPQRQDIVEQHGDQFGSEAEYYISSGPFKLQSWVHNSEAVLVRNDQNWQNDSVAIDQVNIKIILDTSAANNAFLNGELDMISTNLPEWRERFGEMDNVYNVQIISNRTSFLHFNCEDELFSNVNIRKAFAMSIDNQAFLDMVYGGNNFASVTFTPYSMTVGGVNYVEAAGDMIQALRDASPSPQELLLAGMAELGLGDDPSSLNVTFSLSGTDATTRNNAEYFQQVWLSELGVMVEIDMNEWGIYERNFVEGDYQMGWMSWGSFYNDPGDLLSLSVTETNQVGTHWSNAEFDALMGQATKEADDAKRLQLYIEAEELLLEECPLWPLFNTENYWFLNERLTGFSEGVWDRTNYMKYDVTD